MKKLVLTIIPLFLLSILLIGQNGSLQQASQDLFPRNHFKDNTCGAYAGTVFVSEDGGINIPFVVCFGEFVEVFNNGDAILPPDTIPPGHPAIMYAMYSCPPTEEDPNDDPCFTGFAWTGADFITTNTGEIFEDIGVNQFWIAPFTPYDVRNTGGTWIFGDCVDASPEEAVEFLFLNEIYFTSCPAECLGTVHIQISGGYPEFFGSEYTVTNTGAGNLSVSDNLVTISGLNDADEYSFTVEDEAGCSQHYLGKYYPEGDDCTPTSTNRLTKDAINIYPNPTHGLLQVEDIEGHNTYTVNNSMGQLVTSGNISGNTLTLNWSSFASGHYTITFFGGEIPQQYRILKQ